MTTVLIRIDTHRHIGREKGQVKIRGRDWGNASTGQMKQMFHSMKQTDS